jgi:hypothetical protein
MYTSPASRLSFLFLAIAFASIIIPSAVIHAQTAEVRTDLSITSPVRPGDDATITIQTEPNANCQIVVHYKSGPSKARGLIPKTADSKGKVSWTWRVGSRTTIGDWPITVTCLINSRRILYQASLEVR